MGPTAIPSGEQPSAIVGIVSPHGVGAGRGGGEARWMLTVQLDEWRAAGGTRQTKPLLLRRREVDEAELRQFQAQLPPETVVAMRARILSEEQTYWLGELDTFDGASDDPELTARLAALQQTVTHADPRFGVFTLDRQSGWFHGDATWNGVPIRLEINPGTPRDITAKLRAAHALWDDQPGWSQRVTDFAVQQLLPLKNDNWLDDDETALSAAQFVERMTLKSISIEDDDAFVFWHDDGDLFFGHAIMVSGTISGGPDDADIPG